MTMKMVAGVKMKMNRCEFKEMKTSKDGLVGSCVLSFPYPVLLPVPFHPPFTSYCFNNSSQQTASLTSRNNVLFRHTLSARPLAFEDNELQHRSKRTLWSWRR